MADKGLEEVPEGMCSSIKCDADGNVSMAFMSRSHAMDHSNEYSLTFLTIRPNRIQLR